MTVVEQQMQIVVRNDGTTCFIYSDAIDLSGLGRVEIRRASHVEPDAKGRWHADLTPAGGPHLGPFDRRSYALAAEIAWLEHHIIPAG